MARLTGASTTTASDITQTFTGSATTNAFDQIGTTDNLIQAGNLIDLGIGGMSDASGPHQTFTAAGSVTMTQAAASTYATATTGAMDNLQALNAVVDKTSGTLAVNLEQSLTITGAFTMSQNGVKDSGQFGNYAGLKY